MAFGTIYGFADNPRTTACRIAAKANNLDVKLVEKTSVKPAEYEKFNALNKIPTFVGANDYVLTECIAIAIYLASQNEKTTLLGKTKQDYASILRWMSFANSELVPTLGGWFRPLVGRDPYNKASVEASSKAALKAFALLEKHLTTNTYLVGERLTLADLFAASMASRGFEFVLGKTWRLDNPAVTRWYETVVNQDVYKAVVPNPTFVEEGLKNVPPKKVEKAQPPPPAEEEPKPAPKPKHPLDALGKPTMILDDWKRKYSNEDTRSVAMPWFWEHYRPDEYSLWKIEYKYPKELKLTFMSSNLVGGFFTRLEASRKYVFGAVSVYGKNNDNAIMGAFLIRGQEAAPAFDVAPDWESYTFTKLDSNNPEDRKFVEDQWAQDVSITINGTEYPNADGRVCK
ncbi:elongation factor 1-gamma [Histoplasma capsulatum G186AR]|uniref:Elongation factor 1-gamma n=2 Tax=Ajellomyces capsulatus TaxID=5037 RepID=C0NZV5_AJECG|nr:elongation factor 1-gamma [Histoplasma capsulatum G186AR]EEH03045.1 elongation factor 1-gamma [Histoplasma capsulatum G186AR]KAG5296167.1 elongation factor 1-gamma [Histoplasma capsulatum]QSS74149.1 elongation factor 1-gamma [Histoplasma capsulatum G186AR]